MVTNRMDVCLVLSHLLMLENPLVEETESHVVIGLLLGLFLLLLLLFLSSRGGTTSSWGSSGGGAAPAPDPTLEMSSLTLQPVKALAKRLGQKGSTVTLAAFKIVLIFSPVMLISSSARMRAE